MSPTTMTPVTDSIVRELCAICGAANVIYGDPPRLSRYSRDQVPEKHSHVPPEVVAMPGSTAEVQAIIRLANREHLPVTPRGAGTGLSGGAIPVHGGICLSMERMNRILEVDTANLVAVVEPGVVTNKLDETLKPLGLFFAGYPMSEEICTIGGNAAHNAGGGRAIKYGVTKRYITGLEVVMPTGEILTLGGKRFKDVTGYDLVGLLVGSEGTLGVFTKITIRLLPRPLHRQSLLVLFDAVRPAIETVPEIVIKGRMIPASIELMDRISFQEACRSLKESLPYERAGAALLLESDGPHETLVAEEAAMMESVCRARAPLEVFKAETERGVESLLEDPQAGALGPEGVEHSPLHGGHRGAGRRDPRDYREDPGAGEGVCGQDPRVRTRRGREPPRDPSEEPSIKRGGLVRADPPAPLRPLPGDSRPWRHHQRGARHRQQAETVPAPCHGRRPARRPSKDQEGAGPERDPQPRARYSTRRSIRGFLLT